MDGTRRRSRLPCLRETPRGQRARRAPSRRAAALKILLDSCVWGGALDELQNAGFDVVWAGNWSADPGDEEVLYRSAQERRTLVTLDKDFGELAVRRRVPHCGIIRLVGFSARAIAPMCIEILRRYESELTAGALVTVDPKRVRIRP